MSSVPRVLPFPRAVPERVPARRPGRAEKSAATSARRILAVGGGKGGIGKSLISANLGIELARRGLKVAVLDFDLGGANLHTCLGVDQPRLTLSDFVMRRVETLGEVLTDTGV